MRRSRCRRARRTTPRGRSPPGRRSPSRADVAPRARVLGHLHVAGGRRRDRGWLVVLSLLLLGHLSLPCDLTHHPLALEQEAHEAVAVAVGRCSRSEVPCCRHPGSGARFPWPRMGVFVLGNRDLQPHRRRPASSGGDAERGPRPSSMPLPLRLMLSIGDGGSNSLTFSLTGTATSTRAKLRRWTSSGSPLVKEADRVHAAHVEARRAECAGRGRARPCTRAARPGTPSRWVAAGLEEQRDDQ